MYSKPFSGLLNYVSIAAILPKLSITIHEVKSAILMNSLQAQPENISTHYITDSEVS